MTLVRPNYRFKHNLDLYIELGVQHISLKQDFQDCLNDALII